MADMAARQNATQDVVTLADVKALAGAAGPCITLVIPIPNPLELAARLKSALRSVQKQLAERHTDAETAGGLLASIEQLALHAETVHMWAKSLIAFRSPGAFRHYGMRDRLKDVAVVGERFQIRPLLAALAREQRFHLLAIGRHHVRLFRSTPHSTEEVRLEGIAPQNMQEFLHIRQPDHLLENRMTAGPSVGSMQGVVFGTGSESEKEQDRFRHFLKEVERGVTKLLRRDAEPLILAGVEYDVAIYRQLNTCPHLLEQAIHGSPDGQTAQNLHERAWEIVSQCPSEPLKKALADCRKQSGAALVLGDAGAIVKAAAEGRVAGLFLSENVGTGGQPDDPLNMAALQTVLHGGWAFELNPADMPAKNSATALLRF
ncbi:MAG TPA: hypothetical protein VNY30_20950 [Bryobacteraceae bacterium]|jgi:hypothetical protein|nr:hypothetical protein [Bryobacteraceae bacterium]